MRFTTSLVIFLLLSYVPIIRSAGDKDSYLQQVCDTLGLSTDQCCVADKALHAAGYGGLAFAAGTYGIPFIFAQLGFSATGVISGSIAAWWQSMGWTPSIFSAVQSASMTGVAASVVAKGGVILAGIKSYFGPCSVRSSTNSENCKKNDNC